jgi:hypothetical protein
MISGMPSVSFLGLHTPKFGEMRRLYADAYGLQVLHEAPGAVWFALGDGAELHLYAETDDYHAFFGAGPVPGLLVDDFGSAVERLTQQGVHWLTEPDTADGRIWRHYRAPDGNVYEVMGPVASTT